MKNVREVELSRHNIMLSSKLAVRNCQHDIAIQGLNTIIESNDPMGIAKQTLEAMDECVPIK